MTLEHLLRDVIQKVRDARELLIAIGWEQSRERANLDAALVTLRSGLEAAEQEDAKLEALRAAAVKALSMCVRLTYPPVETPPHIEPTRSEIEDVEDALRAALAMPTEVAAGAERCADDEETRRDARVSDDRGSPVWSVQTLLPEAYRPGLDVRPDASPPNPSDRDAAAIRRACAEKLDFARCESTVANLIEKRLDAAHVMADEYIGLVERVARQARELRELYAVVAAAEAGGQLPEQVYADVGRYSRLWAEAREERDQYRDWYDAAERQREELTDALEEARKKLHEAKQDHYSAEADWYQCDDERVQMLRRAEKAEAALASERELYEETTRKAQKIWADQVEAVERERDAERKRADEAEATLGIAERAEERMRRYREAVEQKQNQVSASKNAAQAAPTDVSWLCRTAEEVTCAELIDAFDSIDCEIDGGPM